MRGGPVSVPDVHGPIPIVVTLSYDLFLRLQSKLRGVAVSIPDVDGPIPIVVTLSYDFFLSLQSKLRGVGIAFRRGRVWIPVFSDSFKNSF